MKRVLVIAVVFLGVLYGMAIGVIAMDRAQLRRAAAAQAALAQDKAALESKFNRLGQFARQLHRERESCRNMKYRTASEVEL